jgi:hypothetical protein
MSARRDDAGSPGNTPRMSGATTSALPATPPKDYHYDCEQVPPSALLGRPSETIDRINHDARCGP